MKPINNEKVFDQLIILEEKDCHQSLPDFYNVIADKLSIPSNDDNYYFDCRHISITKDVFEALKTSMKERGLDDFNIASLWLSYGPKTDIHVISDEPFFAAKVEDGFIIKTKGD